MRCRARSYFVTLDLYSESKVMMLSGIWSSGGDTLRDSAMQITDMLEIYAISCMMASDRRPSGSLSSTVPSTPNVLLRRALWSLFDGISGIFKARIILRDE